jgi:hypothetical protein
MMKQAPTAAKLAARMRRLRTISFSARSALIGPHPIRMTWLSSQMARSLESPA